MESRPRLPQAHRSEAACKGCKTIGSSGDCGKQSRTRPNSSPARLAHTATQAQAHRACLFQKCLKSNSYMKPPLCEQVDSMSKRMSKGCPGEQNITASRLGHAGQSATSKSPVLSLHKGAHWSVSSVLSPQTGGFLIACHLPGLPGRHSVSHRGTPMQAQPRAQRRARPPESSLSALSTKAQLFSRSSAQEMLLENTVRISVVGNLCCEQVSQGILKHNCCVGTFTGRWRARRDVHRQRLDVQPRPGSVLRPDVT